MYEAEVAIGGFVVAGCEATGVLEFVEAVPRQHLWHRFEVVS